MEYAQPKYQGDPTIASLANGLGTLGRYGDSYMVHAAEGETVIPAEILAANPELKNQLFWQMRMMGIQDPNRYVVGNNLNSINPITGQPEFFFKKIFRSLKKIFKKVLPIAAPIIGNIIAPGIGGIIASGLVTKLQGGSWGDVLKSAALSYGASALGSGIMGGLSGTPGDTFMGGLGKGLTAPFSAGSNLFSSGAANPLAQGIFGPRGTGSWFKDLAGSAFAKQPFGGPGIMGKILPGYQSQADLSNINLQTGAPISSAQFTSPGESQVLASSLETPSSSGPDWMNQTYDSPAHAAAAGVPSETLLVRAPGGFKVGPNATFQTPKVPGFLEKYLGKTGAAYAIPVGVGAAVTAYASLNEEEQSVADQLEALDPGNPRRKYYNDWKNLPDQNTEEAQQLKAKWYGQPAYSASQLASSFGAKPLAGITPGTPGAPAFVALGGEVMGRGTGTSDSIPARLSDGEFVMTAQAVRNAGGGNRNLGAARMYDMMNRFERGMA